MSEFESEAILSAGVALGEQKIIEPGDGPSKRFIIVPDGYTAQEVKGGDLREVIVATVDSFLRFSERELLHGTTVCLAFMDMGSFETIFNYTAGGDMPGWADRSVKLLLRQTTAWSRWKSKNGVQMDQLAFADFIEANIPDISEPDAATIVEMIQQLKVHRKAEFISVVDPRTGFTNLTFNEQTSGETLKGNIEFCGKIVLGLAPYRGSDKYRVEAALRFNINDQNKLRVFYSLINADLVEEHAFDQEREKVMEKMNELGVPVFDI